MSRLATVCPGLARRLEGLPEGTLARAARAALVAALSSFDPTLQLPNDPRELDAIIEADDYSEDNGRWRRARAATAARCVQQEQFEEAIYEAWHASSAPEEVERSAAATL